MAGSRPSFLALPVVTAKSSVSQLIARFFMASLTVRIFDFSRKLTPTILINRLPFKPIFDTLIIFFSIIYFLKHSRESERTVVVTRRIDDKLFFKNDNNFDELFFFTNQKRCFFYRCKWE